MKKPLADGLISIDVPATSVAVVEERLALVLRLHVKRLNAAIPLADQMKSLAFDAYTQGLIDGAQVGQQQDIRNVVLAS